MGERILASLVDAAVSKVIAVASDLFTSLVDAAKSEVVYEAMSKVTTFASGQFNLVLGWDEDLTKLRDTMETLRGFLQDANEKNVSGHRHLQLWLQDLRDIADEADDILEEVAYEGMQREAKKSKVRRLTLPDPSPLLFRQKMADRVKALNERLDDISRKAERLGLQNRLANMVPEPRGGAGRETHSFLSSQVFGREEDVSKIVSFLVDSSNQHALPVMIIVGMAGLGKTTIAKAVLENDKIRKHFGDNKMWVCVSENFDVKKILMEMLKSCGGSSSGDGDFGGKDIVMKKIQEKLGEKNYLLILDDVWNEERQMWEDLRECLLGISKNKGSRSKVLVTTRLGKVASLMALTDEHIHRPRLLKEDECWSIIKQRAFGDNSVPKGLEGIGKQIARRCKGVPLVARIIGATLQNKREEREWQAITENRVWDSLEKEEGVLDIIKYSYDRLPTLALKQCFAFCSIFPKDFVMEREMLIQLWMALGFLESSEEHYMATEDIGDKYFRYLLSYSLFQDEMRDYKSGRIKSCKMHDLIHDFAQSISKSETLIVEERPRINFSHDVRHLNLIDGREMVPTILGDVAERLQSLFSKHSFSNGVQVDLVRLRVLSLRGDYDAEQLLTCFVNLKRLTCFGNLKRLRYLDISGTQIEELPEFISELYNLQTFRYMDCRYLKMPSRGIGDLFNLKHIYFSDEERMPANLGRLTNLQTLPFFSIGTTEGHKIAELGSLREFKGSLEIRQLELVTGKSEAEGANLKEKVVEHLIFCWWKGYGNGNGNGNGDEDVLEGLQPHSNIKTLSIRGYGGRNLASWMLLLNNLVDLEIVNCKMLHRIPDVNGLSFLQWLHVRGCDELTSLGDGDRALTSMSLKKLSIYWCNKLKRLSVSGLSSLKSLQINDCNELTSLGDGEGALTSLKDLSISRCAKLERFLVSRLSSLNKLWIQNCQVMRSIGDSLSSSTCLKELLLFNCCKLKFIPGLEGLFSLKTVIISHCNELECLPTGLSSCTALKELRIESCLNLVSVPEELKHLSSLVKVRITNCLNLRSFPKDILGSLSCLKTLELGPFSEELEEFPSLSSTSTPTTAPLEVLHLGGWGKLLTLPHQIPRLTALREFTITSFNRVENALLGNLSCLKTVEIKDCSLLRCLSGGVPSIEDLKIRNCPNLVVSFQGELKELRSLHIFNCPKLMGFLEKNLGCCTRLKSLEIGRFSEELGEFPSLRNLSCLETLEIKDCSRLRCLSGGLTSVKDLNVTNCPNLVSFQGELKELHSLRILDCPKLVGFLEKNLGCYIRLKSLNIGRFSKKLGEFPSLSSIHASLEDLTLQGWGKLTRLPQIQHLTALKELRIWNFSGMESLPDWFNNLSSLRELCIWGCSNKLEERCTKGSGPDWHKISHIPRITIGSYNSNTKAKRCS